MGTVDLTGITPDFFVKAVIFLLLIGTSLSLGILRIFQKRVLFGIVLIALAIILTVVLFILER